MIIKPCATRTRHYRGQDEQLEVGWKSNVFNSLTTVAKDSMILEIRDGSNTMGQHNAKQMGRSNEPGQSV